MISLQIPQTFTYIITTKKNQNNNLLRISLENLPLEILKPLLNEYDDYKGYNTPEITTSLKHFMKKTGLTGRSRAPNMEEIH